MLNFSNSNFNKCFCSVKFLGKTHGTKSVNKGECVHMYIRLTCYSMPRMKIEQGSTWNLQAEGQGDHEDPTFQHPRERPA
jgi:hypothetical protein